MRRSIILALLMSAAASQVQAQTPTPTPTQVQTAAPSQTPDKMVCRTREVTGSIVKKRKVCQLQATWVKQGECYQELWAPLQGTLGNSKGN